MTPVKKLQSFASLTVEAHALPMTCWKGVCYKA